jgi:RNA-directed DNA polymerase
MSGPGDRASKHSNWAKPTHSENADGQGAGPNNADLDYAVARGLRSSASSDMSSARELGDLEGASKRASEGRTRQSREGNAPQSVEVSFEESDAIVVPKKAAKTWVTPVESVEGRIAAKGKSSSRNALWAQDQEGAPTTMTRIGMRAKKEKEERFTNLLSHIKEPLLQEAYKRLRKDGATGVDGETWDAYGERLGERLSELRDRIHRGSYHPEPVRRVHIPKGEGTRPLGIPTLEDKLVQQAVKMLLEPIYEASFVGLSYGFRPGRSQHKALDAVATAIKGKVNWVLDADIRSFFDKVDHEWMQKFLEHRIGDRRLVHLVMRMVRAGVMEEGKLREVKEGTPQGGVISPLLANIYLHYAFDLWMVSHRKKHATGEMYAVRYADDLWLGFQRERDARAMRKALAERLAKFSLELHPDKTRLIRFGRFASEDVVADGRLRPETFDFLGFTHIAAKSLSGWFLLKRCTSKKKRREKLSRIREELKARRHQSPKWQHEWLSAVLRGHYAYYAVPTNLRALCSYRRAIETAWLRQLQRRSQRARFTVVGRQRFLEKYQLPHPKIIHPWPESRFAVR